MSPSRILAGLLLFPALTFAQSTPPKAIAFWKTGSATENSQEIRVPDRVAQNDMVMPANTGGKLVDDKDVEGGKAVEFSGGQTSNLRAMRNLEIKDRIYAEMDAKPEKSEHDQSLFYSFGILEFRANPKREVVSMIVWYPGIEVKIATSLTLPLKVGKWNKISGSIVGGKLEFKVNGRTVRGELPDKAVLLPIKPVTWCGNGAGRPMVGRVANIAVCKDAPKGSSSSSGGLGLLPAAGN